MTHTIIIIFSSVSRHKKRKKRKKTSKQEVRRFCYSYTEVTHPNYLSTFSFLVQGLTQTSTLNIEQKAPHHTTFFALFSL